MNTINIILSIVLAAAIGYFVGFAVGQEAMKQKINNAADSIKKFAEKMDQVMKAEKAKKEAEKK